MKRYLLLLPAIFFFSFLQAQPFEVSRDAVNGSKILKGLVTEEMLVSDTAFAWFSDGKKSYTPHTGALEALKKKNNTRFLVFMGTWCHDSHFVLPKFFGLLSAAGIPPQQVSIIGTDRSKKTLGNLAETFHIHSVPTIIVMQEGKEVGRVVEYGKYGMFELDLVEILK